MFVLVKDKNSANNDDVFKKLEERLRGKIDEIEKEIEEVKHKNRTIDMSELDRYDRFNDVAALMSSGIKSMKKKDFQKKEKKIEKEHFYKDNGSEYIIPIGERFRIEKELAIISSWLMGVVSFIIGVIYLIYSHYSINSVVIMMLGAFLMLSTLILMRKTN